MCLRKKMVRALMHSTQAGEATCEYAGSVMLRYVVQKQIVRWKSPWATA